VYTAASPYYGYIYGSNNRGADQQENNEERPMGFIPNPLDPANANSRQFPPRFPTPILPPQMESIQSTTTESPSKSKKL
jgi:hypothetical protein